MRLVVLFLGSTSLIFLGIRIFISQSESPWSIAVALVFVGAGVMTWTSRDSFSSREAEKRFIGVGAIALNVLVAFIGWFTADQVADGGIVVALVILGIVLANVVALALAATRGRQRSTRK